ncbi:MAG: undecaprenyl/decaprenyl-phosphate alpha-N-acetylglucosaminyl 1-phosphate transferase [Planctomycetota bacterium]|nr:MAG: undecaprenyl/decaprenyl-phosphate alpha-N-acetylglucosaminyl 1-phosphate transferase [Planctomycetota bacterium]
MPGVFANLFPLAEWRFPFPPLRRGDLSDITELLTFIVTAAAVSSILTVLAMIVAEKTGLRAKPRSDRWHSKATPLLGGAAIALAFGLALAFGAYASRTMLGIVCAGGLMFFVGLVDDIRPLSPWIKILGQLVAAVILIATGTYVDIYFPYVAIPLSLIWFVGVTNAVNIVDNMDGLAAGMCIIAAFILVLTPPVYGDLQTPIYAAAILGAVLGFLPFNLPPARIFMGDAGSQFLGITLAACAVAGTWRGASNMLVAFAAPVMLFAVPIMDVLFVSVRRKREGRSILEGGTDHISHTLAESGLGQRLTLLVLLLVSTVFAFTVLYSQSSPGLFLIMLCAAIAATAAIAVGLFLFLHRKSKS